MASRIGIDARLIRAYGIGSYIRGLLDGLSSLGGGETYVVFAREEDRALIPQSMELITTSIAAHSIGEPLRMRRVMHKAGLDLVHAPHFNIPLTRLPLVVTMYDAIPFHFPLRNPIAFAYIAFMMQAAARRADRILLISHAAQRDLAAAIDVDAARMRVIHIGVNDMFFGAHDTTRASLGSYFLFVSRVAPHKNLHVLLDALSIVRRSDPSIRLVLAGGKHEDRGDAGVIVPGYVSDERLLELYRGAVAVVMPSLMEGFGLPPLEGMALGTPAITSNAAALVEVTGDAALHVDARSPEPLAEAMLRLVRDRALRDELGEKGREHAQAFTWRRCAEATREVYRELLR
ncbi:MAG TPA: glycosyltransferase family 1 protein [Thermoanaerobaculia bacterium]|nr:glycosyltransferase family 1 protein [Thermoanaerobaculia bacterium]